MLKGCNVKGDKIIVLYELLIDYEIDYIDWVLVYCN